MNYRTVVGAQDSIKKLTETNMIPWPVALELADFAEDMETVSTAYNKARNAIEFKYGKLAEDNEDVNTVSQLEEKGDEVDALLNMEIEMEIRVPEIEEDVFKKLYKFKKDKEEKKGDKEPDKEVEFNINDMRAYKALGILTE